jgi:hypothetical protein
VEIWELQGMSAIEVCNHKMKQWKNAEKAGTPVSQTMKKPDKFYEVRPARLHSNFECGSYWDIDVRYDAPHYLG